MIVIKIGELTFSDKPDPKGVVGSIDGHIKNIKLPALSVNLRRANAPTFSLSFELVGISEHLRARANDYFLSQKVQTYLFEDQESIDDAIMFPTSYVKSLRHEYESFKFTTHLGEQRLSIPYPNKTAPLTNSIVEASTIISVTNDFPPQGLIRVGSELINYNENDGETLNQLTRGQLRSTIGQHETGETVELVEIFEGNPFTLLKNFLEGLNVNASEFVDLVSIDDHVETAPTDFTLRVFSVDNALAFIKEEFLQATGTRFVDKNGKLSLVSIGGEAFDAPSTQTINDALIEKYMGTDVKRSDIVNVIKFEWNYSPGDNRFLKSEIFEDEESIALHGRTTEITYSFKGITDDAFIRELASRYLGRFARPSPEIKISTPQTDIEIGSTISLESRFIPSPHRDKGTVALLEVLKKSVDVVTNKASLTLAYSKFLEALTGFISPSPRIINFPNPNSAVLESVEELRVGFAMAVFNVRSQISGETLKIVAINKESKTVVFNKDHSGNNIDNFYLQFSGHDEVTDFQKHYGFIDRRYVIS